MLLCFHIQDGYIHIVTPEGKQPGSHSNEELVKMPEHVKVGHSPYHRVIIKPG